jgi:hypothetical protein
VAFPWSRAHSQDQPDRFYHQQQWRQVISVDKFCSHNPIFVGCLHRPAKQNVIAAEMPFINFILASRSLCFSWLLCRLCSAYVFTFFTLRYHPFEFTCIVSASPTNNSIVVVCKFRRQTSIVGR